jgi:uncharacterized protein YggE
MAGLTDDGARAPSHGKPVVRQDSVLVPGSGTSPGSGTIMAIGMATVSVAPDEAMLTFVLENDGAEPGLAMTANAVGVRKLTARLSAEGVSGDAMQTANVSVCPVRAYDPKTGQESLTGYRSRNTVTVKLRGGGTPELAGKLLSAGLDAGATGVSGPDWRLQDETPAVVEALRQAALNARAKADALAEAEGRRVGDVVAIREGVSEPGPGAVYRELAYAKMAAAGVPDAPVSAGTLDVTATVTVTYTLDR